MTPQQAIDILDSASARALLPRGDHVAIQEAVQVLTVTLNGQSNLVEETEAEGLADSEPKPEG